MKLYNIGEWTLVEEYIYSEGPVRKTRRHWHQGKLGIEYMTTLPSFLSDEDNIYLDRYVNGKYSNTICEKVDGQITIEGQPYSLRVSRFVDLAKRRASIFLRSAYEQKV